MTYNVLTAYSDQGLHKAIDERLLNEKVVSRDELLSLPSGQDAARLAREHKIPVLIVDNTKLLGKTGPQVARELELIAEHPYHVILTIGMPTSLIGLDHPERVTLLEKPFRPEDLIDLVRKHLQVGGRNGRS